MPRSLPSFAALRAAVFQRVPLWARVAAAAAVLACAWTLAPRPLTTLTVLALACGVAAVAAGIAGIARSGRVVARVAGGVAVAGGTATVLWWGPVTSVLPALLFGLAAAALVVRAARAFAGRRAGSGVRASVGALAAAGAVVVCVRWADIGSLLAAAACIVVLVVVAAALVVPLPRRPGRGVLPAVAAVAAATVVAGIGGVGLALDARQPRPDPFYTWTGTVPAEPGVLLRTGAYAGETPAGARSLRILYTTKDVGDAVRVASAVVAIPTAPSTGPRTVLAWQHGTTGVASACAPSVTGDALTEIGVPGIAGAIERGWAVVATDYPGQGTDGAYPYLVGVGEGRATLDAVRALRQLDDAEATGPVMLWGHSQGGHATLWAAQLAAEYAPELDVAGVAALSAASDPYALATGVVAKGPSAVTSLIFAYVLVPYTDAYPDVALRDTVDPAGAAFARAATTRCVTAPGTLLTVVASLALLEDRPLYTLDLDDSAASRRLRENTATADFRAPLFLGQGVDDEVIPISMQRALVGRVCVPGRSTVAREYPGRTHLSVIAPGAPLVDDLYAWGDGLLDGRVPAGCDNVG